MVSLPAVYYPPYHADYWVRSAHTVVILIILLMFAFVSYATNEHLGSPGKVFDLLVQAAKDHPVEGNADGQYASRKPTLMALGRR